MTSSAYQKLSEFSKYEWEEDTAILRVGQIAAVMMTSEYLCIGIFFDVGSKGYEKLASYFSFLFLALATATEYVCYVKLGYPFKNQVVKTIIGIPVERLRIPKGAFRLFSLAPNYIHIISSALAAGVSYIVWQDPPTGSAEDLHSDHYRNWHDTPLIGSTVASIGIPGCLTRLLIFSMLVHVILPLAWLLFMIQQGAGPCGEPTLIVGELCDCANLQFLKQALVARVNGKGIAEMRLSRLAIAVFVKYPLLWAKTSFLAVMWSYMDWDERRSMLFAVFLAWYGILQLLPMFFQQVKFMYIGYCDFAFGATLILTAILILGLLQQFLHLVGIGFCHETHDFSILHGGCTMAA